MLHSPFFPPEDYGYIANGLKEDIESLPKAQKGHISPEQAEFLYHLIRPIWPQFVVTTGFGVVHSACMIMYAQKSVNIEPCMMSTDICASEQTKLGADIVRSKFKNFIFAQGDSKKVLHNLPEGFLNEHRSA